ncbi:hypothetical protein MIMGU_mgv1a006116mg [Erythranthe guttata]|uniref:Aminotransferase class V domain-containing protein n=1 Tax=Erythranthe guttata TaxID=4155 RepID=A0A022QAS3_ERYGU|nr:hypothetical protein MIMGU_mgv1a006116mg [Erythranthe guttata]
MHSPRLREATQACFQGCCPNPNLDEVEQPIAKTRSTSSVCRHNFAATTASSFFPNTHFTNHESIPSLQESFLHFIKAYPNYSDTAPIDQIRAREYSHLSISDHVCLDYIGVGLFSQSQMNKSDGQSGNLPLFGVTFKSVSLKSQLLHGGEGSPLESAIKKRIMEFLNISQDDYSMVFTANRSAAFKLVAQSYPFQSSRKLLTVYDHESEALDSMVNMSEKRGARVMAAEFKWPRLRIHSAKLRKMIVRDNKKKKNRGLFVFPLQSRTSGASYSYQWMTMAQENGWHVLLDACALGPKEMDSFALSLFQPDFLICSFYKIFGENPTGFGCLIVKKSTVPLLEASGGSGIVSITPENNLLRSSEDNSGTDTELEQIAKNQERHNSIILERNVKETETVGTKSRKDKQGITVATVALTFLANFEDAYRLWAFIAQFLDADFVEKERWRYTALNQKTIEV